MAKRRTSKLESAIFFENSQGVAAQGTLMQLSRNAVVFEVYNPYSVVQLSEVLGNLRIRRGERDIYSGRAVVTNLVSTGLMLIVSASLVDPWSDLAGLVPGPELRAEVREFLEDWSQRTENLQAGYVECISRIGNFLEELSRWLEHGEAVARLKEPDTPEELVRDFTEDVDVVARPQLGELFGRFEEQAAQVPRKTSFAHKAYARRQLHPLLMCSPFVHRTFTKPLGYAGDYRMVQMILGGSAEGGSTYARLINTFALETDTSHAHRNRVERLFELLVTEARRVMAADRPFRVLNVGCGPAAEILRFLSQSWLSDRAELELMDFNRETLDYVEEQTSRAVREHRRHTQINIVDRSIDELLKQVSRRETSVGPKFDLVYCAGLFDYLSDVICGRLLEVFYEWALPGGLVVATNVHPSHRVRGFMEHLLEWNLHLRDQEQARSLAPDLGMQSVYAEATGVNVFVEIRKPPEADAP